MPTLKNTKPVAVRKPAVSAVPAPLPPAPVRPGKPAQAAPKPAPAPASPAAPVAKPGAIAAPSAAPAVSLAAMQEAVKAILDRLVALESKAAKAAKAASDVRTAEEILSGVTLGAEDWRAPYQGQEIRIKASEKDRSGKLVIHDDLPPVPVLLALPRDTDPGNGGSAARSCGQIACHWERTENGAYKGVPFYLTMAELSDVWADD